MSASFAAMLGPDDEPTPGTPLAEVVADDVNPLYASRVLTDHVQQLLGCDLEHANDLLAEWSVSMEMAADVAEITEED